MVVGSGKSYEFGENSWFGADSGLMLERIYLLKN